MKFLRLSASNAKYGGNIYEKMIDKVLSNEHTLETYYCVPRVSGFLKYFLFPLFYFRVLIKSIINDSDVVIQPLESVFWLNRRKKNIVVLHHYDPSFSNIFSRINQMLTFSFLKLNRNKVDVLVVVSEYWALKMSKYGFKKIVIVYNAFDVEMFKSRRNKYEFKSYLESNGRINIYIGNAHAKKGYFDVLNSISDLPVNLLSSGYQKNGATSDKVTNFTLDYSSYINMLDSVDIVITYSQFKEGWCRTAHEALLLGTPVIGSGKGGMSELLHKSNQTICDNNQELRNAVLSFLSGPEKFNEINQDYVDSFTFETFSESWRYIVKEIS